MFTYINTLRDSCRSQTIKLCFVFLILTVCVSCKESLYSNLSEIEANEMASVLLSNGVDVKKITHSDGTLSIAIDNEMIPLAVNLLTQSGLPRKNYEKMGDIFKKEGLISSPLEEKARFLYAMSESISSTLTEIDGVITAKVHIVLPENNPFADKMEPSSASIYIKYNPAFTLEDDASKIKMIVEKSVAGLDYDKISLVMLPAKVNTQNLALAKVAAPSRSKGGILYWLTGVLLFLLACFAILYWLGASESERTLAVNSEELEREDGHKSSSKEISQAL